MGSTTDFLKNEFVQEAIRDAQANIRRKTASYEISASYRNGWMSGWRRLLRPRSSAGRKRSLPPTHSKACSARSSRFRPLLGSCSVLAGTSFSPQAGAPLDGTCHPRVGRDLIGNAGQITITRGLKFLHPLERRRSRHPEIGAARVYSQKRPGFRV